MPPGLELLQQLIAMGYKVEPYVLCIEEVLDLYLPSGKWHDRRTGERGRKPLDQILHFVRERVKAREEALSNVPL